MRDEDLRDRLGAWARPIEAAPPPAVEIITGQARRRRRTVTAGVTAAAATCAAVAVVLPGLLGGPGRPAAARPGGTGWQPPAALPGPDAGPASARFVIEFDQRWDPPRPVLYGITERHPGLARIATIRLPAAVTPIDVVAASDGLTFLLTGNSFRGSRLVSRYYEVRLAGSAWPARVIPLRIGVTARAAGGTGTTALSPGGTELAVAVQSRRAAEVAVVTLATGRVRTWAAPGRSTALGSLSWIDDRTLAFLWAPPGRGGPQIRVLGTASAGRDLVAASRVLVPAGTRFGRLGLDPAPVVATSSAVFALMSAPLRPPYGPGATMAVVAFSVRTGRPERILAQSSESGMGSFCGVLWADRSGRQLVTSCGYDLGSTSGGRFRPWTSRSPWYNLKYVPSAW